MKTHIIITLLTLALVGCYPDGPDYAEDTDVVYTVFDDTYNFTEQQTYAMPDQIVSDVQIDGGDTIYEFMKPLYATPILQAIENNMESYGWQRVDVSEDPDVVLTPAAVSSTTFFYSYWYDWWYGGYWGWYGWYYPPYYTISSYTTGTLVMVMSAPDDAELVPLNRAPAIWISAANGIASGAYDVSRVTDAIDQAFKQSSYLKTN